MSSSLATALSLLLGDRESIDYFEPRRHGYLLVDVEPDQVTSRFRFVDPRIPDAGVVDGPAHRIAVGSHRPERL